MPPLIQNMSMRDVQWAKLKNSYMWNKIYYLRRTKFVVYQLASTIVNVATGLGIYVLRQYHQVQSREIAGFPHAHISTTDLVGSLAFLVASCICVALFYGNALFFDLFWPEREEAPLIQWVWKLSAVLTTILQLAACLAITIVVATQGVHFSGVSTEQEDTIRQEWIIPPLKYRDESKALATVVICWIVFVFTAWSTVVMWRCYTHNNKYGPFADHRERSGDSIETPLQHI